MDGRESFTGASTNAEASGSGTGSSVDYGHLRSRSASGLVPFGSMMSAPPTTPPRGRIQQDEERLGVASQHGDDEARGDSIRTSRMFGRSPPPPPGPPPSEPPPLPPSTHPFAVGATRPYPSARMSSLSSMRKSSLPSHIITNSPISPAGPPPSGDLPPLPHSGPKSSESHDSGDSVYRGHVRKVSDAPPPVSPRTSSLFPAQQTQPVAGPSSHGQLGTPIHLPNGELSQTSSAEGSTSTAGQASTSARQGKPARTPSRHLLQTALDLAQRAVEMDKGNDVNGALAAYREAVTRLKAVMERVGVEPNAERRRRSGTSKTEEEGRTLRGIHDAYVARIQLLSSYEAPSRFEGDHRTRPPAPAAVSHIDSPGALTSPEPAYSQSAATSIRRSSNASLLNQENTPRPSLDDGGMTGIGNLMLSEAGDRSSHGTMSPPRSVIPPDSRSGMDISQQHSEYGTDAEQSRRAEDRQPNPTSPVLPKINGTREEFTLQQALDQAADASSARTSKVFPARAMAASIGLGYPSSPPNMVHSPSSASTPTGTPSKLGQAPARSLGDETGSPTSLKTRKRPNRPSLGLDMETDLSGIDGVKEVDDQDSMEVLAHTPRRSTPSDLGHVGIGASSSTVPASPRSLMNASLGDERPLPPLPNCAPILDANGEPVHGMRSASFGRTSIPLRAPSEVADSEYLVSPSTTQGTISQRRLSRPLSGVLDLGAGSARRSTVEDNASASNVPVSSSASSIRSISVLPPVPSDDGRLRHKTSFSSSHVVAGRSPSVQRSTPSSRARDHGLSIDTSHRRQPSGGLAPPVTIHQRSHSSWISPPQAGSRSHANPSIQSLPEVHRPFHILHLIQTSMGPDSPVVQLTPSIHIPPAMWNPSGWTRLSTGTNGTHAKLVGPPKIAAQDAKVRCIEALILHFEAIRLTGQPLLSGPRGSTRPLAGGGTKGPGEAAKIALADELCAVLDELDEEMDNTHKSLVKQGVEVGGWKGKAKKASGTSKSWGSRISRSMDKMTNSKSDRLDSADKYVDLLAHLCGGAQVINEHLVNFTSGQCTASYASMPEKPYRNIETRLRRVSEFVGAVVVPFVMDDFKQFFLRYLKGGVAYLDE
ncbi:hypothetical protein IAU60_006206 [Kwoniella sp. DSM 27419]